MAAILFSLIFPPGAVPDEKYHFVQAYAYSNLLQGYPSNDHAINMRMTDIDVFRQFVTAFASGDYADTTKGAFPIFSQDETRFFYSSRWGSVVGIQELPQTRIPSALGITLCQLLHINGVWTFYIGRFFNFIAFAVMAFWAVRTTPIAKPAFMALCLLPSVLHITNSYSYDAVIYGLSFLSISLCLKCIYTPEAVTRKTLLAIVVALALLAPCKTIYSVLIFLVLVIPGSCFRTKKDAFLYKALCFVAMLASIAFFSFDYISRVIGIANIGDNSETAPVQSSNTKHSLSEIITNPVQTTYIYLHTVLNQGTFHLNNLLGGSLGWFPLQPEIWAPWLFLLPYIVILLISAQRYMGDELLPSGKKKLLFGAICIMVYLGSLTAMFIASTYSYESVIQGVQGRYFLPILPLLLLILRFRAIRLGADPTMPIVISMFAFNLAYLQFIYSYIDLTFM